MLSVGISPLLRLRSTLSIPWKQPNCLFPFRIAKQDSTESNIFHFRTNELAYKLKNAQKACFVYHTFLHRPSIFATIGKLCVNTDQLLCLQINEVDRGSGLLGILEMAFDATEPRGRPFVAMLTSLTSRIPVEQSAVNQFVVKTTPQDQSSHENKVSVIFFCSTIFVVKAIIGMHFTIVA